MATLSLVIPAYNEELRLPALLDVLATSAEGAIAGSGFELLEALIIDDGSTDRTPEILNAAQSTHPKVKPVLGLGQNQGKGAAVASGVSSAMGDYVLMADVDLSTPLEEIPKLTKVLREGVDIAIGSRAIAGAIVERGPAHRKVLGKSFNGAVRLMTGLDVRDTQCGFKLMATDIARLLLANQTCPGFAFDVELLMRADAAGLRIAEVPVLYIHDPRSSVRIVSASFQMLKDISGLAYRIRLRRRHYLSQRPLVEGRSLSDLSADDPH